MKNKYRVVHRGWALYTYYVQKRFLHFFWVDKYRYHCSENAIYKCKELEAYGEEEYKAVIYPEQK